MTNVMVALPNIGGALCSSRKVRLAPTARLPCKINQHGRCCPGTQTDAHTANLSLYLDHYSGR